MAKRREVYLMDNKMVTFGLFEGLWAVSLGKLFAAGAILAILFQPSSPWIIYLIIIAIVGEVIEKVWNTWID